MKNIICKNYSQYVIVYIIQLLPPVPTTVKYLAYMELMAVLIVTETSLQDGVPSQVGNVPGSLEIGQHQLQCQ